MSLYLVIGTNTEVGKTIATGVFARELMKKEKNVITSKPVQTGCENFSKDLLMHRKIMNIPLFIHDKKRITNPYLYKEAVSPHLAASINKEKISIRKIKKSIRLLSEDFDYVIVESAGGIFSPITDRYSWFDFIKELRPKLILVIPNILGIISQTHLNLNLLRNNRFKLVRVYINEFPKEEKLIKENNYIMIKRLVEQYFKKKVEVEMLKI